MGRDVEFDPEALCDDCGCKGAYDFMGDYLCGACARAAMAAEDDEFTGCGCDGSCGLSIDAKEEEILPEENDEEEN